MNYKSFVFYVCTVLLFVIAYGSTQEVNFSNENSNSTTRIKTSTNTKSFEDDNGLRAASTCYNCNCQCDSYGWTDKNNRFIGNCRSVDNTGAKFCYISGNAINSCRDKQQSQYRKDPNGRKKWFSYEACVTPTRNQCRQQNQQNRNCGDGDYVGGGGGYPNNGGNNNNGGYPNNCQYPNNCGNNNNGGYPNNGGNNNNGGYPNNNNNRPNYPNNNRPTYPNNNRPSYPNNNRPSYPNNNRPNYPNNNRPSYPNNNWTLQQQLGLGSSPRKEDTETSITFKED